MSVSHPFRNHINGGSGSTHMPDSGTSIFGWSKELISSVWQNSLISNGPWMSWSNADLAGPGDRTPTEIRNSRPVHFNPGSGGIITILTVNGQPYAELYVYCASAMCVMCGQEHIQSSWHSSQMVQGSRNVSVLYQMLQSRMSISNLCITFLLCFQHPYVQHITAWNTIGMSDCFLWSCDRYEFLYATVLN